MWRQRAPNVLPDKWCKTFWEFIMRRRLGLIRFFLANQQTLAEAWREPMSRKRGYHVKEHDPNPKRSAMEVPRPLPQFRKQYEQYARAKPSCATGRSSGGAGQRRARSGNQRFAEAEVFPKRPRPSSTATKRKWNEDPALTRPRYCFS